MTSNVQPMSEKERLDIRRFRHEISCAECKRLKLKCDRKTPCASCTRRGCASICPYGTLEPSHQRGRMIVSDSTHLHKQIDILGERIKQLEEAVAKVSPDSVLLRPELLKIKFPPAPIQLPENGADSPPSIKEEEKEDPDVVGLLGSLSVGDDGESKYFGSTAVIETLLMTGGYAAPSEEETPLQANFIASFPFEEGSYAFDDRASMNQLLLHLPPRESARQLCERYLARAWITYRLAPDTDVWDDLYNPIYDALEQRTQNSITSENLSLFFFILALGSLSIPASSTPKTPETETYFQAGRAALCLRRTIKGPTTKYIHALVLNGLFLATWGMRNQNPSEGMDSAWCMFAIAIKMAQMMGLHRDIPHWNISPKERENRRRLWWDLSMIHVFTSISLGRPISIHLSHVDTPLPVDDEEMMDDNCKPLIGYHRWRYEFLKEVVFPFAEGLSSVKPREYSYFLELDKKLRHKELPPHLFSLEMLNKPDLTLPERMKLHFVMDMKAMIFMHIHLPFFATAYSQTGDPSTHKYFPSVLATLRCAIGLIDLNARDFEKYPDLLNRSWVLCNNLLTSALVTAVVTSRSSRPKMAARASYEFKRTMQIFSKARSRRAKDSLALLRKLTLNTNMNDALSSLTIPFKTIPPEKRDQMPSAYLDTAQELRMLSGQTKVFSAPKSRSSTSSPRSRSASVDRVMPPLLAIPNNGQFHPQSLSAGPWSTSPPPLAHGFDSTLFNEPSIFAPSNSNKMQMDSAMLPPQSSLPPGPLSGYESFALGYPDALHPQQEAQQFDQQVFYPMESLPSGQYQPSPQGILESAFAMPMDASELYTAMEWPSNELGAYVGSNGSWHVQTPSG